MKTIRKIAFDLVILFLLSLLPFLWLRGGAIVAGHDAGLPLAPTEHFVDRLSVWTNRYEEGSDQSFALAGFFIHGYEALLDQFPLSLSHQQAIQFSTYFFLFGVSMYIFSSVVMRGEKNFWPLVAAVVYQFNHFILQAWFIAERTKFSLYIALPLILALLFLTVSGKYSPFVLGIVAALTVGFFNGGGFLPLYGALLVSALVFAAALIFFSPDRRAVIKKLLQFSVTGVFFSLLVHAYWLLPFISYVRSSYAASVSQSGGVSGVINWLQSISENSSYMNLFRLQGVQEWYVNPEHPYARYYSGIVLKTLSFMIPFTFIFALKFKQKKNAVIILSLLFVTLLSLFFMAGSHPPFGWFYIQMIKYIPGFIAFRTPFYKFSPGLYVAFAVLFSFVASHLLSHKLLSRVPQVVKKLAVVALILAYNFPFFSINFFQYTNDLSTKVTVPEYVNDYRKFANGPEFPYSKTLLLPGRNFNNGAVHYQWGYWSLATVHSLLDINAYVVPPSERKNLYDKLLWDVYLGMARNDGSWLTAARHLGIDSILVEKDFAPFEYLGQTLSGEYYSQVLATSKEVKKTGVFGEWELYEIPKVNNFTNQYVAVIAGMDTTNVASFLFGHLKLPAETALIEAVVENPAVQRRGKIIFPDCQNCYLPQSQAFIVNPAIIFTPGSIPYLLLQPFLGIAKPPTELLDFPVPTLQSLYLIQTSYTRKIPYVSFKSSWDNYVKTLRAFNGELEKYLEGYDPTLAKNSVLQSLHGNILLQSQLITDIARQVNQKEEAQQFLEARSLLFSMLNLLGDNIRTTLKSHEVAFVMELPESGTYEILVNTFSTNFFLSKKPVEFSIDGQTYHVNQKGEDGTGWFSLAPYALDKGFHEIILTDVAYKRDFKVDPALYSVETHCNAVPLGVLDGNRYLIELKLKSNGGKKQAFFHVLGAKQDIPLLPYWGIQEEVESGELAQVFVPFEAWENEEYTLYICDDDKVAQSPLTVESISLDRLPKPTIVLSESSDVPAMVSDATPVDRPSNTSLSVRPPGSTPGLLTLNLPYANASLWQVPQDLAPVSIDGRRLGLFVNGDENGQPIVLKNKVQNYYLLGWAVSAVGMVLAMVIVIVSVKRRKQQ